MRNYAFCEKRSTHIDMCWGGEWWMVSGEWLEW
jgi:hypothetical protein